MKRIYIFLILIFCLSCSEESINKANLRCFIDALNEMDLGTIDAFLTDDFNYYTGSDLKNKQEYLNDIMNRDTTWQVEIVKLSESDDVVKTKVYLTNYKIRVLEMTPIIRERKYFFDDNHKIKAMDLVDFVRLPEHEKLDKYFGLWAALYYPDLALDLKLKLGANEDYFEQRHLLLLKLKQDGLHMLDSARIYYEDQLRAEKEEQRRINRLPAAPINNYVLEKISNVGRSITISKGLTYEDIHPKMKKQILEQAFIKSGYNYPKTLQSVAENGFSFYDDFYFILTLLSPLDNLPSNITKEDIYTEQELKYVNQILRIRDSYTSN